jgi:hypothetical protein
MKLKQFAPSKRTLDLTDYYDNIHYYYQHQHRHLYYFTQFPPMVFGVIFGKRWLTSVHHDQFPIDCKVAVSFDQKSFYVPPMPNMFGFSVCVPTLPGSVDQFVDDFWSSSFGNQYDAVLGLLYWFGDSKKIRTIIDEVYIDTIGWQGSYSQRIKLVLNNLSLCREISELFVDNRPGLILQALTKWEEISKQPNALKILQDVAEEKLMPFTFEEVFADENKYS